MGLITTLGRKHPFHLSRQAVAIGSPVTVYIGMIGIAGIPSRRPVIRIRAVGAIAVAGS